MSHNRKHNRGKSLKPSMFKGQNTSARFKHRSRRSRSRK
jgi:hypothetical protein